MQKRLVVVGNSVALILDKDLRHALGLKRTSIVNVMTDGRRLIVEPDGERQPVVTMSRDEMIALQLPQEFETMFERWGLPRDVFRQLHHCPPAVDPELEKRRSPGGVAIREMLTFLHWLTSEESRYPTPAEWATMRRFHACYQQVAAGASWTDAAAFALAEIPMMRDPEATPIRVS